MVSFLFFFLVLTEKRTSSQMTQEINEDEEPGLAMKRQPRPTRASIGLEKPDRSRRHALSPVCVILSQREKSRV